MNTYINEWVCRVQRNKKKMLKTHGQYSVAIQAAIICTTHCDFSFNEKKMGENSKFILEIKKPTEKCSPRG